MLTESSATVTKPETPETTEEEEFEEGSRGTAPSPAKKGVAKPSKMEAEKKEREHILAMNQILAKQVMEKSRMVAGNFNFL